MNELLSLIKGLALPPKLVLLAVLAVVTHLSVVFIRRAANHALSSVHGRRYQKLRSIGTLATSALVFVLKFLVTELTIIFSDLVTVLDKPARLSFVNKT